MIGRSGSCPCPELFKAVAYCCDCPYRDELAVSELAAFSSDQEDVGVGNELRSRKLQEKAFAWVVMAIGAWTGVIYWAVFSMWAAIGVAIGETLVAVILASYFLGKESADA